MTTYGYTSAAELLNVKWCELQQEKNIDKTCR